MSQNYGGQWHQPGFPVQSQQYPAPRAAASRSVKRVERTPVRLILLTTGLLLGGSILLLIGRRDMDAFSLTLGAVMLWVGGVALIVTMVVGHLYDLLQRSQ